MVFTSYLGTVFEFTQSYAASFVLAALLASLVLAIARRPRKRAELLPHIHDPIPFVYNTLQFVFNNDKFMKRATYVVTPDHVSAYLF